LSRPLILAVTAALSLAVGACGGGGSSRHHRVGAAPRPIEAEAVVKAFLYHASKPSRDCPRLWAPSSQGRCASMLRRLTAARNAGHLPKIPATEYQLSDDSGGLVTIEVGNRQPTPQNPPDINATFQLRLYANKWKIVGLS